MADKLMKVSWNGGSIVIHVPSHKRAIDVALEYIRQPEANRFTVEPARPEEEKDAVG